jgi:hypothetical protein
MTWLSENKANSTQPFSAFIEVFQKNGEGNAARELQIGKADKELNDKAIQLFALSKDANESSPKNVEQARTAQNGIFSPVSKVVQRGGVFVTNLVGIFFGYVLSILADHGYRPEKVGWFVAIVLLLSFVYFWLGIKVIAIRPQNKSEPALPIGFTFLFDRLLPAYQIREDHYKIDKFLLRVRRGDREAQKFKYMHMTFYVLPAGAQIARRVERALDVIKFLGLVLAIFLVAALNSLVSH